MNIDDAPIRTVDEDKLNRTNFARGLKNYILNIDASEGMCIGILGSWGSGKTSLINMVLSQLVEDNEDGPLIVKFNPWNFTSKSQLYGNFFSILSDQIMTTGVDKAKRIGKLLINYAVQFENAVEYLPIRTPAVMIKVLKNFILKKRNLENEKDEIVKRLKEYDHKIVVVIDDLDRLSSDEIRLIFQLVCVVGKFPNIIYILAFDREIVTNSLASVQECDGELFLEKVIQMPIELPQPNYDNLCLILDEYISSLTNQFDLEKDDERFFQVLRMVTGKEVKTVRDINRLSNALALKLTTMEEELNVVDLIVITVVEINYPEFFYWIRTNKDRLVCSGITDLYDYTELLAIGKEKRTEYYTNLILKIDGEDLGKRYLELIKIVFPHYAEKLGDNLTENDDALRRKMSIDHKDYFDRYFALSLGKQDISRTQLKNIIATASQEELESTFKAADRTGQIIFVLNEISAYKQDLSDDRKFIISKALLNTSHLYNSRDENRLIPMKSSTHAAWLFEDILKSISEKRLIYDFFIEQLNTASTGTLPLLITLLMHSEKGCGRFPESCGKPDERYACIPEEYLDSVEDAYVNKLEELAESYDLLDYSEDLSSFQFIKELIPEKYEKYIRRKLNEGPIEILKYAKNAVGKNIGSDGVFWTVYGKLDPEITIDHFRTTLEAALKDGTFFELPNESQHRIIAFELSESGQKEIMGEVRDENVESKIAELRELYGIDRLKNHEIEVI